MEQLNAPMARNGRRRPEQRARIAASAACAAAQFRLVVALDGSELAERVLPHALALADRLGADLTLLRVAARSGRRVGVSGTRSDTERVPVGTSVRSPRPTGTRRMSTSTGSPSGCAPAGAPCAARSSRDRLPRPSSRTPAPRAPTSSRWRLTPGAVSAASSSAASPTPWRATRRARRSWWFRARARPGGLTAGHGGVLVALDGFACAERSLPHVELIVRRFGAAVTLLRTSAAASLMPAGTGPGPHPRALLAADRIRADRYLERVAGRLRERGLTVRCEQVEGPAAEVIVRRARALAAALVAVATDERSGLMGLPSFGVAEAVVRGAPCPVLLVVAGDRSRPHA